MRCRFTWVGSLLLATTVEAQTFTVGQGHNFATIAAAVSTVPDGSTLLVLPGTYGGFAISGKGLTILCDPGVQLLGASTVTATQPHQSVVLRGLTWASSNVPGSNHLLEITQCAGPVLVEGMSAPQATVCWPTVQSYCQETSSLRAQSCTELTLRDCALSGTTGLVDCDTSIESCTLTGDVVITTPSYGQTGLRITGGTTQISGQSIVTGGPTTVPSQLPASGIFLTNGHLRMLGGHVAAGSAFFPWAGARAIQLGSPTGTIRLDPRVTYQHSGNAGANFYQVLDMPAVTATSTASPGTIQATVATAPGDLVILVVGLPGPPTAAPGFADAFWLDPAVHFFHAIGVHQPNAPITGTIPVPPGFTGTRLRWHGVALGPSTGLQASNPATSLIF